MNGPAPQGQPVFPIGQDGPPTLGAPAAEQNGSYLVNQQQQQPFQQQPFQAPPLFPAGAAQPAQGQPVFPISQAPASGHPQGQSQSQPTFPIGQGAAFGNPQDQPQGQPMFPIDQGAAPALPPGPGPALSAGVGPQQPPLPLPNFPVVQPGDPGAPSAPGQHMVPEQPMMQQQQPAGFPGQYGQPGQPTPQPQYTPSPAPGEGMLCHWRDLCAGLHSLCTMQGRCGPWHSGFLCILSRLVLGQSSGSCFSSLQCRCLLNAIRVLHVSLPGAYCRGIGRALVIVLARWWRLQILLRVFLLLHMWDGKTILCLRRVPDAKRQRAHDAQHTTFHCTHL